ncbi:sensor domain-containing diguanylate cyclase [Marinobacterium rhizophilum]|uniref:diguanylate cyclase n=1 Tax=Marinobacterium rhizophilum TaxID=420402 RepID=A0ABY5HD92_9GAMM|nr:GGDEF domain-containing protein [Marinobacterium rhizophilum]UTW10089.1 diguanylate cyclase [Marinobacterium rhizophilum]
MPDLHDWALPPGQGAKPDRRLSRTLRRWLHSLAALLLFCWSAFSQAMVLPLQPHMDGVSLAPYLSVLEDPGRTLTLDDVRAEPWNAKFVPLGSGMTAFGVSSSAWWVRLQVHNGGSQPIEWILDVPHNTLDFLDSYETAAGTAVITQQAGDHRPFAPLRPPSETFNFSYLTPAGGSSDIYLRFAYDSAGIINIYQEASTAAAYAQQQHSKALWLGVFLGASLLVILYNLFLMLSVREAPFFWYLLYASAATLMYLSLSGLGYRYLWHFSPLLVDTIPNTAVSLFYMLAVQFSRSFLDTRSRAPRIDCILLGLIVLAGVSAVLLFTGYRGAAVNLTLLIGLALGLFPALGAWLWYRGHQIARGYTLAWSVWSLTVIGAVLRFTGILPSDPFSIGATRVGMISQTVLLAFALADRINILRTEKTRAEMRELSASVRSTAELEAKVKERTQELEAARQQAEVLAREDPLTGLLNRRAFFERGNEEVGRALRHGQPLSVIMLDIDSFKTVNDAFGHGVGDRVIREVARTLTAVLRDSDIKARMGGEEFAVVLVQTPLDSALQLAERLRQAVEACRVETASATVGVTSSFGVAQLAGDTNTLETILASADSALYQAKNSGRNRVLGAASSEPVVGVKLRAADG